MYDSQKAWKKQVLFILQFFTETNFIFISLCIFSPTHISVMSGTEAAPLLEPLEHDRHLFFYWLSEHKVCEFIPHLQLHHHPKSKTQPHVYCTGQFRRWFLSTAEPSVTPQARDQGKLSMNSNLGNICCVRKMNIPMDGLMPSFVLPQTAKDLFH